MQTVRMASQSDKKLQHILKFSCFQGIILKLGAGLLQVQTTGRLQVEPALHAIRLMLEELKAACAK